MALLVAGLALFATSVLAIPPSPGVCQPLASISFSYPPAVAPGLSSYVAYKNLTGPRGMRFDSSGNLLVVERTTRISALTFRNDSICVGWEKRVVLSNTAINHGIEIGPGNGANQYLYASSAENLFRWEYDPVTATVIGSPATLVWNMTNVGAPSGDHVTRTLLLEPPVDGVSKHIIISRGSAGNGDDAAANVTTGTAQIRRFPLNSVPSGNGWAWGQGEVVSYGNRNGVGIAFSKDGESIWEAENSSDNLHWQGIDVHQDNPAEELNLIPLKNAASIPLPQRFYGYPSCFTVWNSSSVPYNGTGLYFNFTTGEQFSIRNPPTEPTDEWCAEVKNNVPPALSFPAHSAPLDIVFNRAANGSSTDLTGWHGDAFVSFHGSWNRDAPTGYKVVRIPFKEDGSGPVAPPSSTAGYETLVGAPDLSKCASRCTRPVGLAFDVDGRLFASSDSTGEVFVIQKSST
ncbi:L-sorbosone dehydrogenase [Ceratobasidium sp. AG-Ba]|nr:L-sorbosone dehydrogenase [Ceratobasidium sp. AG-Ba]